MSVERARELIEENFDVTATVPGEYIHEFITDKFKITIRPYVDFVDFVKVEILRKSPKGTFSEQSEFQWKFKDDNSDSKFVDKIQKYATETGPFEFTKFSVFKDKKNKRAVSQNFIREAKVIKIVHVDDLGKISNIENNVLSDDDAWFVISCNTTGIGHEIFLYNNEKWWPTFENFKSYRQNSEVPERVTSNRKMMKYRSLTLHDKIMFDMAVRLYTEVYK